MPEITSNESIKQPSVKTADDIADFLKPDKEEVVEEKKEEPKKRDTKPEKPVKEDEEDQEEIKEDDDDLDFVDPDEEAEKLDLETKEDDIKIDTPPRKKEILAKYPNVFKDFPFLEKVIYRDKEYNALFGSFDDAKEIAEKAEVFQEFESQLLSGNTEEILKNVKETDSKAFDKIVDNYLKTIAKVDKEAYFQITGNVIKQVIMEMAQEAKKSENDDLRQAAALLNQFIFSTSDFTPPQTRTNEKTDKNDEAEKERLAFVQERFESSRDELQTRVDNTLKATIDSYIDPTQQMTSYIRKKAVADTLDNLREMIGKDSSVQKNLDRLWRAAFDAKFSRESLDRIKSFYLGRAKVNLPTALKKARAEALKDLAPRAKKQEEETEEVEETTPRKRGPIPSGRPSQPKKNEMKKGESVSEFFARD